MKMKVYYTSQISDYAPLYNRIKKKIHSKLDNLGY